MKVLLIVVLTLASTHGATVWNQTFERDFEGPSVYAPNTCALHIKNDIPQNMMIMDAKRQVMQPNKGIIEVQVNEEIAVSCTENINSPTIFQCVGFNNFKTPDNQIIGIKDFWCDMNKQLKRKGDCLGANSLIAIGFPNGNLIEEQIEVCFDNTKKQTLYAKMTMSKGIDDDESQSINRAKHFKADGRFIQKSILELYEYDNQKATFGTLLGIELDKKLNVGHLVAWADFPYTQQRLLTMFYLNTAPQWKDFNNGNWKELEERIRKTKKNNDYYVYTGTFETLQLPDSNKKNVKMYLHPVDKNNKIPKYPVPQYFWKVLIEKTESGQKAKGIAFIGRNNVFSAGKKMPCTNQINNIKWLNDHPDWKDYKKGRIIACTVEDFKTLWVNKFKSVIPDAPGGLPLGEEL